MRVSDIVRDHLKSLERDGRLTPAEVVEDARKKSSPLHDHFEWDVKEAAQARWLDTARRLIRTVQVEYQINRIRIEAPVYIRDPERMTREQGYVAVERIRNERDLAEEAFRDEVRRLVSILSRCQRLAIALGIENEVDIEQLAGLAARLPDPLDDRQEA